MSLSAAENPRDEILGGDRNLSINGNPAAPGQILILPSDALSWTSEIHGNQGNVLMADGRVEMRLPPDRDRTLTNLLLIP